jgi:DNA-binding NarL/FixJ family response regulator
MKKINLLIADSREIFRIGLESALCKWPNIKIVGTCIDGEETVQKAIDLKPDIILLDENISNPDCIEVSKRIRQLIPKTRVIVLTDPVAELKDPFYVFGAQAGGYVDRQTDSGNLVSIINRVMVGDFFVSPSQGRRLVEEFNNLRMIGRKKLDYSFTKREKEVLTHIANGLTNREIASTLYITENTVKAYVTRIMQKMQLQNRHQIMLAVSQGLVSNLE